MQLEVFVTAGLGDNSYVLGSNGEAVVVDPQRDVRPYLDRAEERGLSLAAVLETHVHNDYVSGARELQASSDAVIVGPASAAYAFPFRAVSEGDGLLVGDLRLMAIETPGHTPEHVAYLVYEEGADAPVAVFTGGSLMVGGAGRTDLLGQEHTDELTRRQYRTLRRLSSLPDAVQVLPTHGAGSFCGAAGPGTTQRVSTMAEERLQNAALGAPDEEAFVRQQLTGLLAYPTYYRHMASINRAGPKLLRGLPSPAALDPEAFARAVDTGARVVDARWRVQFARAHVPGSVNVELDDTFASYVGWVVPFGEPVLLVLPEPLDEALGEAATQLLRIGYERIAGYLAGGIEAWRRSGGPIASYPVTGLDELCRRYRSDRPPQVLDVRQRTEWDEGHIEGSRHVFVGDVPDRIHELPRDQESWVICASGHRASTAASLLDRDGIRVRLVDGTGVNDFLKHCASR